MTITRATNIRIVGAIGVAASLAEMGCDPRGDVCNLNGCPPLFSVLVDGKGTSWAETEIDAQLVADGELQRQWSFICLPASDGLCTSDHQGPVVTIDTTGGSEAVVALEPSDELPINADAEYEFTLELTDKDGRSWNATIPLTVTSIDSEACSKCVEFTGSASFK